MKKMTANSLKTFRSSAVIALLPLILAWPGAAADRYIVRVNPAHIQNVARQHGARVESTIQGDEGLYVVSLPSGPLGNLLAAGLKANPLVANVEPDSKIVLPEVDPSYNSSGHKLPGLNNYKGSYTWSWTNDPWQAYLNQPANQLIRLSDAQKHFGFGGGSVAVIDTGVDYTHPVLFPVVDFWRGWDFVAGNNQDVTGNYDWTNQETTPMVDQETTPMVDSSGIIILNQETTPMVDQETTPMVDGGKLPAATGHGTMVAGIIHLVAPLARIVPIKAFSSDGTGTVSNLIAAIRYAADQNVNVINISASTSQNSTELQNAIAYATSKGVIVVASEANNGTSAIDYPAGLNPSLAVGSTDDQDSVSVFSNHGSDILVFAPGEAIVTTFPRNHYAMGWGTSFSTPYVAGTIAWMQWLNPNTTAASAAQFLQKAADHVKGSSAGRLDIFGTLNFAKH